MAENYVLLETIELTTSAASITFDNIPQTGYTDLKIVASARTDRALEVDSAVLRFNGDTTSGNYTGKRIYGTGSSVASDTNPAGLFTTGANATSNVYGNSEVYITNYTSSTTKCYSFDNSQETNASTSYVALQTNLWSGTAAIYQIVLTPEVGTSFNAGSTFSLYGVAALGTTPTVAPLATGGNMVSTDGTYWYHTFLTSGVFTPQAALTNVDYLVVAGGGGSLYRADGYYSGGGGGGGLRSSVSPTGGGGTAESKLSLTANINYAVAVGAGGANTAQGRYGIQGNNSSISGTGLTTITSVGGGYGSVGPGATSAPGGNGGSGGGAGSNNGSPYTVYSGGTGTANQGYNGGQNEGSDAYAGGAGGGAAGAGGNAGAVSAGKGGTGGAALQNSISGTATYYAGGGFGGKGYYGANAVGNSGTGYNNNPNTGMGGSVLSGAGQSGIVIIRYAMV